MLTTTYHSREELQLYKHIELLDTRLKTKNINFLIADSHTKLQMQKFDYINWLAIE